MKRSYAAMFGVLALCALALPAFAQPKIAQDETVAPLTGPNCDITGYKVVSEVLPAPFAIPDNDDMLHYVSSLPTAADGDLLTDVIAAVTMRHTWVGDVVLRLEYYDCATGAVFAGTNLLCRARGTNVDTPAPCGIGTGVGASGDLGTGGTTGTALTYVFSSDAAAPINEGVNPTPIPAGCYQPAFGQTMAVFAGLQKGGCWSLSAGDWAAGDLGYINDWTIYMKNEGPVATRSGSWGSLKTIYR